MATVDAETGNPGAVPAVAQGDPQLVSESNLPPHLRNLVLTPLKLRLETKQYSIYAVASYWSHILFFLLVLLQLENYIRAPWYILFLPLWLGAAICVLNQISFFRRGRAFVRAQLGPPPPSSASTGIMILYRTMSKTRFRSHVIDCIGSILDHLALAAVEAVICYLLMSGRIADPTVCWRLVFLPFWLTWLWCLADWGLNYPGERHPGAMRMLFSTQALLVALKLDGVGAYSWNVTFILSWLWLGSLFLFGCVLLVMVLLNGTCLKVKDLSTVLGYAIIMISSSSMLPSFVYLARFMEGFPDVQHMQILMPQILGWLGMWVGSLVVSNAISTKTHMRNVLAAAGRVWTRQEEAARLLLAAELEDTQEQVSAMSDDALANLALKLMMGKARPTELMKVGSTLYRRMAQLSLQQTTAAAMLRAGAKAAMGGSGGAGGASDTDGPQGDESGPALELKGRSTSSSQEEAMVSSGELEMGLVHVQISIRPAGASPLPGADQGQPPAATSSDTGTPSAALTAFAAGSAAAPAAAAAAGSGADEEDDDDLCTICYDGPATCVLLECGHGGYCWRCAHIMFMKPPNECPVCRRRIDLVVEISDPRSRVGQPAAVLAREPQRRRRMRAPSCLRPLSPGDL